MQEIAVFNLPARRARVFGKGAPLCVLGAGRHGGLPLPIAKNLKGHWLERLRAKRKMPAPSVTATPSKINPRLPDEPSGGGGSAVVGVAVGLSGTAVACTMGVLVGRASVGGGGSVGGMVSVATAPVASADSVGTAVGVSVGGGVTVQNGGGVGFQGAPGVGVLPFSGGASTMGTMSVYPCTVTTASATQPRSPLLNWMSHHSAVAARPTILRTSRKTNPPITSYSRPGPLRTLVASKVWMVGLLPQGTAVGKKPPTGVGAIFTDSKVDVGVGSESSAGVVGVGSLLPPLLPPPEEVAVGGGGVGVRVGIVWLVLEPYTTGKLALPQMVATNSKNMRPGKICFFICLIFKRDCY